jgi:hypothetical protein
VNPGSEPERDNTGLPPVDIEIPDDARELDRDVQAYRREQRALRRQRRSVRLRGSLGKEGIVLPLLACCLILALITGTLLTVFSATSDVGRSPTTPPGNHPSTRPGSSARQSTTESKPPGSAPQAHGAQSASANVPSSGHPAAGRSRPANSNPAKSPATGSTAPAAGKSAALSSSIALVRTDGTLPQGVLVVGSRSVQLADVSHAVLMLMPAGCNCGTTVARVAGVARRAGAQTYLIGTSQTAGTARRLATRLHSRPSMRIEVAVDSDDALRGHYTHRGLTAIVVTPGKHVYVAQRLKPGDDLTDLASTLGH